MIPLRDKNRPRTTPYVNYLLIGLCVLVFLYELSLGEAAGSVIGHLAVVPARVSWMVHARQVSLAAALPLVTSIFLHGGWLHLLGNMLYLYIFGDNVEDRLGHAMYALFFLLCGIASGIAQVASNPSSPVPLLGASGAIAGVLGAYLLLFPKAKILTLIPLFFFFPILELPAFLFLGFWILLQFLEALLSGSSTAEGGVAWWAHMGGFLAGALLLPAFLGFNRLRSWLHEDSTGS
jgi:membrane associated rhomboid family serine protease